MRLSSHSWESRILFKKPQKIAISKGALTTTVRRWKRPQAKVGGTYNIPPYGAVEVTRITRLEKLSKSDAHAAGYATVAQLRDQLPPASDDVQLYRVDFRHLGLAQVNQPDRSIATEEELKSIRKRLARMDKSEPWTGRVLKMIAERPGTRAGDLAPSLNMPKDEFKRRVRRLKGLGLTHSLDTGYKLSKRGEQHLNTSVD